MISLDGDPIPIAPAFGAPLAAIVIEWSRVEIGLEADLGAMRQFSIVSKLAPEIPRPFDQRLRLWRRSVRALYPSIEAYQLVADMICDKARDLSPKRNHLVHGQWAIEGPDAEGRWSVRNVKSSKGSYQVHEAEVTAAELDGTADAIRKLSGLIMGFVASKMLHTQNGWLRAP